MNLTGKKGFITLITSIVFLVLACDGNDKPDPTPDNGFDKTAMLTNYADNLIIPGYTNLQGQLQTLETAVNAFLNAPTTANQQTLKPIFKEAYLQFQRVSVYQVGPAETVLLSNFLNTFPANTTAIENNINSGTYNFAQTSVLDQQGFPALDYLLFSPNAIQRLTEATNNNRKKYIQDVINRSKSLVNTVATEWNSNYRTQFVTNTRTDVGSPIGYLVNQFAFELDQLKGPRIGWPFGKMSGGTVFADKSEGYYAGISGALAVENLNSLKKAYTGNNSGKGISDYLVALKKDQLNSDVIKQFDTAIDQLKAIPDPMSNAFTNNKELVDAAYRQIQTLLTYVKTDVASATGVRITYQDSDGD
ncbi:imelysin family protein [Adhaeribacter aquaticus]|uniref:imelysin family protein n=1 Tax=Adhaeribacter aquaticus TaxID=299567 RepID=UPI000419FB3D|nr:imelysin family protein [Adhaeribacter aquaticus]